MEQEKEPVSNLQVHKLQEEASVPKENLLTTTKKPKMWKISRYFVGLTRKRHFLLVLQPISFFL